MRKSPERTTLAKLRVFLGLRQYELAAECECSTQLIQACELGTKKISESLAMRVALATGVSIQWLLQGDIAAPILDSWGKPYSRSIYESRQANLSTSGVHVFDKVHVLESFTVGIRKLAAVYLTAYKAGNFSLVSYHVRKQLDAICEKFDVSADAIETAFDKESPKQFEGTNTTARESVAKFEKEFAAEFKKRAVAGGFHPMGDTSEFDAVALKGVILERKFKREGKKKK